MVIRQDIDEATAHLTVTVTREVFKPKLDAELKRFRNKAPIKGFRPGQAPMEYVKKLYGPSIFVDTLNDLMVDELYDFIKTEKIRTLGQPMPAEGQKPFSVKVSDPEPEYTLVYEVGFVPNFDLKGMSKKDVYERATVSNLDELAEEDLNQARRRKATYVHPENDIQGEDMVKISFRELDGDRIKEEGWSAETSFLVSMVKDESLKTQVLTLKKGDTFRLNLRLLETELAEKLYRQHILALPVDDKREVGDWYEAVVEEVTRRQDAELDEDFFKGFFGANIDSKEGAIGEIKNELQRAFDDRSDSLLFYEIQKRMLEENKIPLPEKFLRRWMLATNDKKLSEENIDMELPAMLEHLRWTLIKDFVKDAFVIEVTQDDIRQAYANRIRGYFQGQADESLIQSLVDRFIKQDKDLDKISDEIEADKIFHAIKNQVTVVDKPVTSEQLGEMIRKANETRMKNANHQETE